MRLILLIIFLFIVNCKFDKVVDSHGIHYLDKKNKEGFKIFVNTEVSFNPHIMVICK